MHAVPSKLPLFLTLVLSGLIIAVGCSGGSKDAPTSPQDAGGETPGYGSATPMAVYRLNITPGPSATLEPVDISREGAAQGDSFEADITPFLVNSPCSDCIDIDGFGLTPDFDLWVDISLRHPFDFDPNLRPDLVVYDPRLILIPELNLISTPLNKFFYTDSPDTADGEQLTGVFDLVRNADGYTHHYDVPTTGVTDPVYMGSLNPFKWYFTEDDPMPEFEGADIPNRRMAPGDGPDTKRWLIDVTDTDLGGFVDRSFLVVVEASYGAGTTKTGRISGNPTNLEKIPEYNIKEAYDVRTDFPQTIFDNTPQATPITFSVEVLDWQNSTIAGTGATQVNCPSDVMLVSADLPGLPTSPGNERILPYLTVSSATSGTGNFGDPYIYDLAGPTLPGPDLSALTRTDPYLMLIRVEDEYNDSGAAWGSLCQPGGPDADGQVKANFPPARANTIDPLNTIQDFVAYRIVPVFVRPAGPPTITLNPPVEDLNDGLVTLSGQILGLDASINGITPAERRLTTHIEQIGPGPAPMNTPWILPLQTDEYGRFQISMPLLPGGANTFNVYARNQYPVFQQSSAAYPPVSWNPAPGTEPGFRISMAWEPATYETNDKSDLDLHLWEPVDPGPNTLRHLYFCNGFGGQNCDSVANPNPNLPECTDVAKPCGVNGDVTTQSLFVQRADGGYGVEVIDGVNSASILPNRSFAVGVNYFTNRRDALTFGMRVTTRVAVYGAANNLQIFNDLGSLDRENFNNALEFYGAQGNAVDYNRSWYRPCDLQTDGSGNILIVPPALSEAFLLRDN